MKAVIFNRAHLMYQRGETAGFPDDHAQKLIDAGIARDPETPLAAVDPAPDRSEADVQPRAGAADQSDTKPTSAKVDPAPDTSADSDTKPAPGAPPAQGKRR